MVGQSLSKVRVSFPIVSPKSTTLEASRAGGQGGE